MVRIGAVLLAVYFCAVALGGCGTVTSGSGDTWAASFGYASLAAVDRLHVEWDRPVKVSSVAVMAQGGVATAGSFAATSATGATAVPSGGATSWDFWRDAAKTPFARGDTVVANLAYAWRGENYPRVLRWWWANADTQVGEAYVSPLPRALDFLLQHPAVVILGTLVAIYLLSSLLTYLGLTVVAYEPGGRGTGKDPYYSLARLQLGLWTVFIACTYVALVIRMYLSHHHNYDIALTTNLLLLMGISAAVPVAKTLQGETGGSDDDRAALRGGARERSAPPGDGVRTVGVPPSPVAARGEFWGWRNYFVPQAGGPASLATVQMAAWTVIGLIAYVLSFLDQMAGPIPQALPEVGNMLLLLMGVSQASFLYGDLNDRRRN